MGEWISVKDRLPEIGIKVLVFITYTSVNDEIDVDMIDPSISHTSEPWGTYLSKHITHWMPLPEAPHE